MDEWYLISSMLSQRNRRFRSYPLITLNANALRFSGGIVVLGSPASWVE
jgi:hypothetical protein